MTRDILVRYWLPRATLGLAIVAVLVLAVWLRRRLIMGVVGVDNFDYVTLAHSVVRGVPLFGLDPLPSSFHLPRLAMVVPLAVSFAVLGPGQLPAVIWPLACSIGSVGLAFLVGRHIGGTRVGLAAALALALHPLEALYAGTPLPDTVVSLFVGLTVYLFLLGLSRQGRAAGLAFVGSGAALGVAYYARPNALVIILVLVGWLAWSRRRPTRSMLLLPAGALLVLALGTAFVVSRGGPAWFELIHLFRLEREAQAETLKYGVWPLFHFATLLTGPMLGRSTLLAGAAALLLLLLRDRRLALPAIWCGLLYLYLELGSQYPRVSIVLKEERYLTPLVLPGALMVGLAVDRVVALVRQPWARLAVAAVLVVGVWTWVEPDLAFANRFASRQRAGPAWGPREAGLALRQLPPLPVYVTVDWLPHLNFFTRYRGGLDTLDVSTFPTAQLRRMPVDASGRSFNVERGYVVHDERYGLAVPSDWVLVTKRAPHVAIYYAPDPALPDPNRIEMSLGVGRDLSPDLNAYNVGAAIVGGEAVVAVDWQPRRPAPRATVQVELRDADTGTIVGRQQAGLGERALPSQLWQPGGLYRDYYRVEVPAGTERPLAVALGLNGAPASVVASAGPPDEALRIEMEQFAGVPPVQQSELATLVGWGAYRQGNYSRGQAGIARQPGAVARASAPRSDLDRVWLRVYSYGAAENVLDVSLDGQPGRATWRSGAAGLGWLALEFPRSGSLLEIATAEVGQRYAIVDQVALSAR